MIAIVVAAAALTCGAVPRPGIAMREADGEWRGAAIDACRAAARALGRPGFRFHGYHTRAELDDSARDDLAILTAAERRALPAQRVVVQATVAASEQLLVARLPTLPAGRPVLCFIVGSAAEDALTDWLERDRRPAIPIGFQEPDEMTDALASGKCAAVAIDAVDRGAHDTVIARLASEPVDALALPPVAAALARHRAD